MLQKSRQVRHSGHLYSNPASMNEILKKNIMHAIVNGSASYVCNSCNSVQVVYSFTFENLSEHFHDYHHHINLHQN